MTPEVWELPYEPPLVECPECGGRGTIPDDGTNDGECSHCNGTGEVEDAQGGEE